MRKGMRTLPARLCTLALLTVAGNLQATDRLIISKVVKMDRHPGPISNSEFLIVKPGDQLKFKAIVDYLAPGYDPNPPGDEWAYDVCQKSPGTWRSGLFGAKWSGPNTTFTYEYTHFFTVPALIPGQEIVFELRRRRVINGAGLGVTVVATKSVKCAN